MKRKKRTKIRKRQGIPPRPSELKALEEQKKKEAPSQGFKPDTFKANPIPESVSLPLYEYMMKKEDLRRDRLNRQSQESLKLAKLPPRMELWAKTAEVRAVQQEEEVKENSARSICFI